MPDDRTQILDTVYCYATGIDTRDWALYRSIFSDEIEVDFSSYDGNPARRIRADDWVVVELSSAMLHWLTSTPRSTR